MEFQEKTLQAALIVKGNQKRPEQEHRCVHVSIHLLLFNLWQLSYFALLKVLVESSCNTRKLPSLLFQMEKECCWGKKKKR